MAKALDSTELTDEEVFFWRRFIEWWEAEKGEPAPELVWLALGRAQRKKEGMSPHFDRDEIPPPSEFTPTRH